jgi:hypothetical protein
MRKSKAIPSGMSRAGRMWMIDVAGGLLTISGGLWVPEEELFDEPARV